MQLPHTDELPIESLSRLFDKTSECYKYFWFQAIVTKVLEGKDIVTFEELVHEMIANAWYMVTEYHLNLGPKDTLEHLIEYISEISHIKPPEKKTTILEYLKYCNDPIVTQKKRVLTYHVPYRLQAPFMESMKGKAWNGSERSLIAKINQEKRLMYYFTAFHGMNTAICIQPEWSAYISKNQEIIKGWLQYNMIIYLQKRNPSVPGIVDKLHPPTERKLDKVQKYWKLLIQMKAVREIYGNEIITEQNMSIDHFVPWSYVAHDEFWNLHPTIREINSSKSNHLPDWNLYFSKLCRLEYFSYQMMNTHEVLQAAFEKCAVEHLNDSEIQRRIYRQGLSFIEFSNVLEEIIQPVYQSAKNFRKNHLFLSATIRKFFVVSEIQNPYKNFSASSYLRFFFCKAKKFLANIVNSHFNQLFKVIFTTKILNELCSKIISNISSSTIIYPITEILLIESCHHWQIRLKIC